MKCGGCLNNGRDLDEFGMCMECNLKSAGTNLVVLPSLMEDATPAQRAVMWDLCDMGFNIHISSPALFAATHGRKTGWEVRCLGLLVYLLGMRQIEKGPCKKEEDLGVNEISPAP